MHTPTKHAMAGIPCSHRQLNPLADQATLLDFWSSLFVASATAGSCGRTSFKLNRDRVNRHPNKKLCEHYAQMKRYAI